MKSTVTHHHSHGKAKKDENPEHFGSALERFALDIRYPKAYPYLENKMMKTTTSTLMVVSLCASIVINIVGLAKTEQWSQNPWLLTVLVALLWGVLQESSYPNLSTS